MNSVLKFRPSTPDDEPFLRELRGQFDAYRLLINCWNSQDDTLARRILDLQYKAHQKHYQHVKDNWETKDNIIELDGKPIGRFIACGDKNEIKLADILVEKRYRGLGVGQAVLDTTKAECIQSKRVLRLYVDKLDPVVQLYLKQGFYSIEDTGTHYLMEWKPDSLPDKPHYFFKKSDGS
ncbi:MAG: GNAT family N-acetyltransferase [Proteobacteria bacterium]|nr:GNAT family N-acetyltransferase [Pseudomonadota bacterium]